MSHAILLEESFNTLLDRLKEKAEKVNPTPICCSISYAWPSAEEKGMLEIYLYKILLFLELFIPRIFSTLSLSPCSFITNTQIKYNLCINISVILRI